MSSKRCPWLETRFVSYFYIKVGIISIGPLSYREVLGSHYFRSGPVDKVSVDTGLVGCTNDFRFYFGFRLNDFLGLKVLQLRL